MKHPTSRNRVQRQAELYSKKYSIDVAVAENNSNSSGEEYLKVEDVGGMTMADKHNIYFN